MDVELLPKQNNVYEFFENGTKQDHPRYYGQATPRKYVFGSCTVSMVMMNDSRYGNLTSRNGVTTSKKVTTYAATDFSTWTDLWYASRQIYRLCGNDYKVPGWISIGDRSSIGVLMHATNSTIDKRINGTETSTLVAAVPSGWAYLGCNWDSRYNRQLKSLSWAGENLGIARCAAYCDSFNYFGVENGEE
ncbi:MAG: hypothetical protein Q9200_003195 [Gallowayella weberi]